MLRCVTASILLLFLALVQPLAGDDKPRPVGATDKGFVLPNGWTISPAGQQVVLSDLPLNIIPLADNKHALVATSGYNKHELCLVDLATKTVADRQTVGQSWFGLAFDPEGNKIWWAGGGANMVHTFALKDRKLTRSSPADPDVSKAGKAAAAKQRAFQSGVTWDGKSHTLYALDIDTGTLSAHAGDTKVTSKIGGRPYDVVLARNGSLYVSNW